MNNSLSQSRAYLMKKFQIKVPTDIYKHLIKNKYLFEQENLSKLKPIELLYYIIFLGTHPERRNQGEQAKLLTLLCLKAYRPQMLDGNFEQNSQLLLSLSNVLLYDELMIKTIIKQVEEQKHKLQMMDMIKFQHCLYKLNIHNEPLNQYFFQKTLENHEQLEYHEYVQYMHIRSNLFHLNYVNLSDLTSLLSGLHKKSSQQFNHYFTSKFSFQFCQMMYNLYPEIITQEYRNLKPSSNNPFQEYFNDFLRDYTVSKQLVDRKQNSWNLDYLETQNIASILKIKEAQISRKLTSLEQSVSTVLDKYQIRNERTKRVLLYDVDYVVNGNLIINCNDPVHFVEDFDGRVKDINPNHLMQSRHLKYQGRVVDLNYFDWDKLSSEEREQKLITIVNSQ